ncbi:MAG: tyrosine-type recombinase/integrase [Planctomycetes bacterium]|nr:tyrosine-type recombinase/integrase [Planctomycetota bacterium]
MIIEEGLQKFLVQLEADGRSVHTRKQYARHIRLFSRWAADVGLCGEVSEVSHEDIARFLSSPVAKTRPDGGIKKAVSMNALRSSLKGFFQYIHQAGYTPRDPTRLTRRAICGNPPPRALSDDEKNRLMAALSQGEGFEARRDHALFHTLVSTGIRIGSALSLNTEDVDIDRGELWIRVAKRNQPTRVFLGKAICEHLTRYLKEILTGPIFPSRSGTRMSQRHAHRRFSKWLKEAGITRKASPHALRHTFGCMIYNRTKDLLLLKTALGHKSIMSTLIYTDAREDGIKSLMSEI